MLIPGAQAQDTVRVRGGEHEGYSRLVFDWGANVSYILEKKSSTELLLKFQKAATFDDSAIKSAPVKNLQGFSVVSESPLQISIKVSEGTTSRDFSAGNRIMVDVYDPPAGQKTTEKPPEKIPEKPPENVEQKKEEPKQAEAAPSAPQVDTPPQQASTKDLQKLQDEAIKVVDQTPPQQPQEKKPAGNVNTIIVSSTRATGMAVFNRAGKIWMVSDEDDLLLSPQVNGPDHKKMLPVKPINLQGAKAFLLNEVGHPKYVGQGGGLLWRVIASSQENTEKPVDPQREHDDAVAATNGKVIWPLDAPGEVIDVPDPVTGGTMKVVTVSMASQMAGAAREFVEFETLNSPIGLAILPKVDDLSVTLTNKGVEITRPGGLSIMPEKSIHMALSYKDAAKEKSSADVKKGPEKRIFDFDSWQMGGIGKLDQNRNAVLSSLGGMTESGRIEGLLALAKMHLANGLWAEADGFLGFAAEQMPELEQNPEFIALDGATKALGRISDLAFEQLSNKDLEGISEIGYWKAYALADLEDWQQAAEVLPASMDILTYYPQVLRTKLGLVLAEVALRAGKIDSAEQILKQIEAEKETLVFQQKAALEYLQGEAQRQHGNTVGAETAWKELTTGKDTLYRAKSGLALTRLQLEKKEITPQQAIDKLERLRYAWRGDELEALINYWLGKTYFETGEYVKGMNIMNDAAGFAEGTDLGERINSEMKDIFADLFIGDKLQKLSGPDAAALYDQFSELIPSDQRGDLVAEKLADHLANRELFGRAETLLRNQVNNRLKGLDAYRVSIKLAAIELLDSKPVNALGTLGVSKSLLDSLPEELRTPERYTEVALFRARALSQDRRPDQALALLYELPKSSGVNRLRADIAWRAGYWDDAAQALGDVITDEDISLTRPLSTEHAALLLQRAVALNLASDRVELANMREKYSDAMLQTEKARVFEVITRPRQSSALADRDTLKQIVSEVDLFKDFLDTYKKSKPITEKTPSN